MMLQDFKTKIEYLVGEIEIKPVKYTFVCKVTKRKWWQFKNKYEYWIESEFMRWGPFSYSQGRTLFEMLTK